MTKSIVKTILLLSAAALTSVATAGQPLRTFHHYIGVEKEDFSGFLILAEQYCTESPGGSGGIIVSGYLAISGDINGHHVQENENYDDLESCPNDGNIAGSGADQSITIDLNGIVVSSNCTAQAVSAGKLTDRIKYPGQKQPQVNLGNWRQQYTYDTDDSGNSGCVVTATYPDGGETFDVYTFAGIYNGFSNQNH